MDDMHLFLSRIKDFKNVNIRPEVGAFVESYYEEKSIKELFLSPSLDKKLFPNNLYDFQWEGIAFAASRKGSILAHEIGLGKTVQALGAAIYKMHVFDFKKTTILCPKNLKQHWVLELHKWVSQDKHHLFEIESFERMELKSDTDFLIIDEAQKIDDYDSVLLQQLHQLNYKHILMITDSKIHRSLMKFYAMAGLIDQHLLTPLWEFSYKHCLFDAKNEQEIVGYYNLENLPNKLSDIYLRREKAELKEQIVSSFAQKQIVISVALSQELLQQQSKYSQQCVAILQKKQANHYDYLQLKERLQEIVDLGLYTADSSNTKLKNPKLEEFQHFIKHKLLCRSSDKIIVFAQGTALQKQLKRILNEDYKKVQILKSKEKANPEFEVFIVEELLQDDLPTAQHYIYFHVPREPHFISQRSTKLKGELMDTSMYLLQSSPSFEEVLLKWEKNHNSLLNQLAEFLGSNNSFSKEISLRLKEELSHQLKALVVAQKEEQMSLFEDIMKPKIAVKKEKDRLQLFVEKWKESLLAFEQLSSAQQHLIRDGKLRVRESEKELLFAFLKR
ncbi:MAG: hypothetical protein B7C24_17630 [Bacteroidetes bacterium 4572_77]|nr:MAG: hypothetical protein B7C24_17630 [Bacteroidetes bacterium 4572_77]